MEIIIESVVLAFYKKATTDFLIGYHFRKIASESESSQNHPLKPPIEAFKDHLPRINQFWKNQLLGTPLPKGVPSFDLIGIHKALHVRRGEVGRWVQIFEETLNEVIEEKSEETIELKKNWLKKVHHFQNKFLSNPSLFKQP
ncbi:MAG: hypothetical protein NXH75_01520 [Halobacteriovoraceae bacterium]|nr:hypothetical protein [Halobacteriovoraceae bacterium]